MIFISHFFVGPLYCSQQPYWYIGYNQQFNLRSKEQSEKHHKETNCPFGLLKQINEGRKKGYSNKDIVSAVLRAITPGRYLRNVLETTENLTLDRLIKFFAIPLRRKKYHRPLSSTTSLAKSPEESTIQFTYRAMNLRQKLVLASKSPGAETPIDKVLAKRLFLKALETGLLSDVFVSETKPLLKNIKVSDKDLIFAMESSN